MELHLICNNKMTTMKLFQEVYKSIQEKDTSNGTQSLTYEIWE